MIDAPWVNSYKLHRSQNNSFGASITVAQRKGDGSKGGFITPTIFSTLPHKEPQVGSEQSVFLALSGNLHRPEQVPFKSRRINDKARLSKLESLYADDPQDMYRVFIRAMTNLRHQTRILTEFSDPFEILLKIQKESQTYRLLTVLNACI